MSDAGDTPLSWIARATGRSITAVSTVAGELPVSSPAASLASMPHCSQCASRSPVGTRSPPCVARFRRAPFSKCASAAVMCAASSTSSSAAGLDGLQRAVLRELRRSVAVEPLVDLLAPAPLRERLLGRLRSSAQLGVQRVTAPSSRTPAAVPWAWSRASRRSPADACRDNRGRTWPRRMRAGGRSAPTARRCRTRTPADRCRAGTARVVAARGARSRVPTGPAPAART